MRNIMATVLIVDDEMLIRWAVAESLVAAGFMVTQAGSASEALQRLAGRTGGFAVAVLDLRLPDSNDFDLLRRIKAIDPACRIILMTADGTPGILDQAVRAGAFSALAKPFDMDLMASLVSQAAAA